MGKSKTETQQGTHKFCRSMSSTWSVSSTEPDLQQKLGMAFILCSFDWRHRFHTGSQNKWYFAYLLTLMWAYQTVNVFPKDWKKKKQGIFIQNWWDDQLSYSKAANNIAKGGKVRAVTLYWIICGLFSGIHEKHVLGWPHLS